MIKDMLQYLSNPVMFSAFSVVVGLAYVMIWVTSLKELVREDSGSFSLETDFDEPKKRGPLKLKYSSRRPSVLSKAVTEHEKPKGPRKISIARAVGRR
jgi:hypothetical protein